MLLTVAELKWEDFKPDESLRRKEIILISKVSDNIQYAANKAVRPDFTYPGNSSSIDTRAENSLNVTALIPFCGSVAAMRLVSIWRQVIMVGLAVLQTGWGERFVVG